MNVCVWNLAFVFNNNLNAYPGLICLGKAILARKLCFYTQWFIISSPFIGTLQENCLYAIPLEYIEKVFINFSLFRESTKASLESGQPSNPVVSGKLHNFSSSCMGNSLYATLLT